tara:strand:+ start:275 stop:1426 length:1152 start_codon:yes stop_codon:yes gene_type:complete
MSPELPEGDLNRLVASSGIRRIHVLSWRDLEDPEAGGSEVYVHEVASRWAAAGLAVSIRTSAIPGGNETTARDGYEVVRRSGRYQVFPQAVLDELTRRQGPRDALVEVWNGVPFLSPLWSRKPRIVVQHHDHGALWPIVIASPFLARAGWIFEHRLAPLCYKDTPIVTLSPSSKAELVANLGHAAEQIHVIPPGINPRYRPGGFRAEDPTVLSVGRLTAPKRLDVLLRALKVAREHRPGLRMEVVGSGPESGSLLELAKSLELATAVEFLGRIGDGDLVHAYQRARVVASASMSEGWGMTLTEGAACGTPGIATDIPGHRDAIDDGRSGLLAATDADLPDLMLEACGPRWDGLSAGALSLSRLFDWDRTATEVFRVLASTVSS